MSVHFSVFEFGPPKWAKTGQNGSFSFLLEYLTIELVFEWFKMENMVLKISAKTACPEKTGSGVRGKKGVKTGHQGSLCFFSKSIWQISFLFEMKIEDIYTLWSIIDVPPLFNFWKSFHPGRTFLFHPPLNHHPQPINFVRKFQAGHLCF